MNVLLRRTPITVKPTAMGSLTQGWRDKLPKSATRVILFGAISPCHVLHHGKEELCESTI